MDAHVLPCLSPLQRLHIVSPPVPEGTISSGITGHHEPTGGATGRPLRSSSTSPWRAYVAFGESQAGPASLWRGQIEGASLLLQAAAFQEERKAGLDGCALGLDW